MDGVGWGGVAFIWLSFLWPVISTAVIYALRASSSPIIHKGRYWVFSIAGGYVAAYLVGRGITAVAVRLMFSNEVAFKALIALSLIASAAVPFVVARFAARKCS